MPSSVENTRQQTPPLSASSRRILRWTICHRVACIALLLGASALQTPFDSSPRLVLLLDASSNGPAWLKKLALPFVRWDTLHFLGIASPRPLPQSDVRLDGVFALQSNAAASGLGIEQSLAFQPGIVWLLRAAGYTRSLTSGDWSPAQAVLLVSVLAALASCASPVLLFCLTARLTRNTSIAGLAGILSILSTSPATFITPTPEPFFSAFALLGHLMLASDKEKYRPASTAARLKAALCFMLATCFRANGVMLGGFLVWDVFFIPAASRARPRHAARLIRILSAASLTVVVSLPFLLQQTWAYHRFCSTADPTRPWCDAAIPSVYGYVQSQYWGVGPFRYWTLAQLPNWILALPVLVAASFWLLNIYSSAPHDIMRASLAPISKRPSTEEAKNDDTSLCRSFDLQNASASPALIPHAHFTLATLLLLIVSSHVQIALRFASPGGLPAVWWGLATLLADSRGRFAPKLKTACIAYLFLWNVASIILYAGFYPPA